MPRLNREQEDVTFDKILSHMVYVPGRVLVEELRECIRCGQAHRLLSFKQAQQTDGSWTHWTLCPTNGDPILLLWKSAESGIRRDDPDNEGGVAYEQK